MDEKLADIKSSDAFAVAMDVDAAGLPFLKNMDPPAGRKSVQQLAEIIRDCLLYTSTKAASQKTPEACRFSARLRGFSVFC